MDKKIGIELFRYENLLFGKVLYMDESLRASGVLYRGKLVDIRSVGSPDLEEGILFVGGREKEYDHDVFKYTYSSEEKAIEVAKDIENGINFINKGEVREDSSSVHRVI